MSHSSPLIPIVAGGLSGMVSQVLMYPFDVLRTRIQSELLFSPSPPNNKQNLTLLHLTFLQTITPKRLYRNLYVGLSVPLSAQMIYKANVFGLNSVLQTKFFNITPYSSNAPNTPNNNFPLFRTFACGAGAGAVNAGLFVTPVEFVRNKMIVFNTHTKVTTTPKHTITPLSLIKDTIKTKGFSGLYKGAGVTVARDFLGCGVYFITFAIASKFFERNFNGGEKMFATTMAAGGCSGIMFWVVAMPFDTVKTIIQVGGEEVGLKSVMKTISFNFEGGKRLYRGWQAAAIRGGPGAAFTFYTYDRLVGEMTS